jgi:hypothetical protein
MSKQIAHNFVKSVYTDFFSKNQKTFLDYVDDVCYECYSDERDSPHKVQLYTVIVTSAPTQNVKVVKFDISVENINDHRYFLITCGKFNTTVRIRRRHITDLTDFINYTIYRCLEGVAQIPYEVVQKNFFIYKPDEVSYKKVLKAGLEYDKLLYCLTYCYDNDLTKDDQHLNGMTVVLKNLLEECKKIPEVSEHELKVLTSIYERHKTAMENELIWPEHCDLLEAIMLSLVISCKYIHSH